MSSYIKGDSFKTYCKQDKTRFAPTVRWYGDFADCTPGSMVVEEVEEGGSGSKGLMGEAYTKLLDTLGNNWRRVQRLVIFTLVVLMTFVISIMRAFMLINAGQRSRGR
jgi:hypothetical protein